MGKKKKPKITDERLYNEEANAYIGLISARRESLQTRAGLLVAASAIAASFAAIDTQSAWSIGAVCAASASTLLGVAALWPTRTNLHRLETVRNLLLSDASPDALRRIADTKYAAIEESVRRLEPNGLIVRAGFATLAVSVLLTVVHVLSKSIHICVGGASG